MRSVIISFMLLILLLPISSSFAQSDELNKGTCNLLFKNGLCSASKKNDIGTIKKTYIFSVGKKTVFVKTGETGSVFVDDSGKEKTGSPQEMQDFLKGAFDSGETPDAMTVDCGSERKNCKQPGPAQKSDCTNCTVADGKSALESKNLDDLKNIEISDAKLSCSEEDIKLKKQKSCWSASSVVSGVGSCVANALWGLVKPLLDMGEFIYDFGAWFVEAPTKLVDWMTGSHYAVQVKKAIDAPIEYIKNWWGATKKSEDRSSDAMSVAAHADAPDIKKMSLDLGSKKLTGPKDLSPNLLSRFSDFIMSSVTDNFGCEKWSGIPHAPQSQCLKPWKGFACADCWTEVNMVCGVAGIIVGQIPAGKLFASFLKYFMQGVAPVLELAGGGSDALQAQLSKVAGKVAHPDEISYFKVATETTVKVATKIGDVMDKISTVTSDFLMAPFRAMGRALENRLPPELLGKLTSTIIQSPSKAAQWFYKKLQLEVAESSDGMAKRLAVAREQALGDVRQAEKDLAAAQKTEQKYPNLTKPAPEAPKKAVDFGLEASDPVTKIETVKTASGESAQKVWVKRTDMPNQELQERYLNINSVDDARRAIAPKGEDIITLGGTSGAGYQDASSVMDRIRAELSKVSVSKRASTYVNIGATDVGIGQAYQVAKEMGFKTSGIVSSQGLADLTLEQTKYVDKILVIHDDTWGGFANGVKVGNFENLSPTSKAMVGVSNRLFYVGGQDVSGAEIEAARELNLRADFVAADLNHDVAIQKAIKAGKTAPTDFTSPAAKFIEDVPNGTSTAAPVLPKQEQEFVAASKQPPRISSPAVRVAEKRLADANANLEVATRKLDVHELKELPETYSKLEVEKQLATAKKLSEKVSASKLTEISKKAEELGELEQAKNIQIAYKGVETINRLPNATAEAVEKELAPTLHESWRATRKATPDQIKQWISDQRRVMDQMAAPEKELFQKIEADFIQGKVPAYLPRIKPLASSKFGQTTGAVDIANSTYDQLPDFWKLDNQKASENIVSVLFKQKGADGKISSELFDKISKCGSECGDQLDEIASIYKKTVAKASSSVDEDPIMMGAAREFNKWKERTGTSYTHELELGIVFETVDDLNEKRETVKDFKHEVLQSKSTDEKAD